MKHPETAAIRAQIRDGVLYYTFPIFDSFSSNFCAAFSSRLGGVSTDGLSSLNLGIGRGDTSENTKENFARFGRAAGFDAERAVLSQQTHSCNIRFVTQDDMGKGMVRPRDYIHVDGLITTEKNLPLLTNYADCTPLLFYAADQNIAGSAHAGWRGTVAGMAHHMVTKLKELSCQPQHIYAAIGPAAGPCCYEIDADTAKNFFEYDRRLPGILKEKADKPGKYLADLWLTNKLLLLEAGLPEENIAIAGLCTICHANIFYSHRVQGENRGAMAAVAMLK